MFTDLEEKAFVIIDDFLKQLQADDDSFFSTYAKPKEYFLAKELMEKYSLVTFRAPGNNLSIVDITQTG